MAEPQTVNVGLIVPNTGDLVNLWGAQAVNPDFVAIDGFQGGVQTLTPTTSTTLTSPAAFTPTPGAGPTQAQNAVLRFTGALSGNVQITLPLPGYYIVENLTTGAFVLSFRAVGTGKVIAVDQGDCMHVYNDGTDVKFVNFGHIGKVEIWAGFAVIPPWVTACSVPRPYLLCDGTIYNFSDYPFLGAKLGSAFGGNGITTFGVPDLQGRSPIPFDGTGTRVTAAVSGINGQLIGSTGGNQAMQQHTHTVMNPGHSHAIPDPNATNGLSFNHSGALDYGSGVHSLQGLPPATGSSATGISLANTGAGGSQNMPPVQVTGIAVIRAA